MHQKWQEPRSLDRGFLFVIITGVVYPRWTEGVPRYVSYGTRSAIVTTHPSGSSKANSRMP